MTGESQPAAAPPIRALMICAGGLSSSLVETHIRQAAQAAGVRLDLQSLGVVAANLWDFAAHPVDVVLVAPQVRFLRKRLAARLEPQGIRVLTIEPTAFGMAEGGLILRQVLSACGQNDVSGSAAARIAPDGLQAREELPPARSSALADPAAADDPVTPSAT